LSLLLLAPPARSNPSAVAAAPALATDEVQVIGERVGPRLWRVAKGDHVLWILGTLGPLPKHMTWRSNDVEAVLEESQEVLAANPAVSLHAGPFSALGLYLQWRRLQKNDGGAKLKAVLPEAQYARFSALKQKYAPRDGTLEELRPMFAARRLYQKAVDAAGLTPEFIVEQAVFSLAKKHRVRIQQIGVDLADAKALLTDLAATPAPAELQCLETTMTRLETDLGAMQERARAWARGDVDALRRLPYLDQRDVCWAAISTSERIQALRTRIASAWVDAAEAALQTHGSTLALHSMSELLRPDGPLSVFRAQGYSVEGP